VVEQISAIGCTGEENMKTTTAFYTKKYTSIYKKRNKAMKELKKYLKARPDFTGKIEIYNWTAIDNYIDILITEKKEA